MAVTGWGYLKRAMKPQTEVPETSDSPDSCQLLDVKNYIPAGGDKGKQEDVRWRREAKRRGGVREERPAAIVLFGLPPRWSRQEVFARMRHFGKVFSVVMTRETRGCRNAFVVFRAKRQARAVFRKWGGKML